MNSIRLTFLRILAIFSIAIKRTLAQRGLMLATLLGLVVTIALVLSIPLYSEAVYYRVLSEGLFADAPTSRGKGQRPPVAFLFKHTGSFTGPVQWQQARPLDRYLSDQFYTDIKLSPSQDSQGIRIFNTGLFGFFQEKDAAAITDKPPELHVGLATMTNPDTHIEITEGSYPLQSEDANAPIEILISRFIAEKMGIQIGEITIVYDLRAMRRFEDNPAQIMMRVAGVWEPAVEKAEFWEHNLLPADNMLIVAEQTFAQRISPMLTDEIYQGLWYLPMNAAEIYVNDVVPLLLRIKLLEIQVDDLLPGTTMYISPVKILENYEASATLLNLLLITFSIPIINLVLTFISLVVTLTVEYQRNQVAALRSRGATMAQVVGITAMESSILDWYDLGYSQIWCVGFYHNGLRPGTAGTGFCSPYYCHLQNGTRPSPASSLVAEGWGRFYTPHSRGLRHIYS